MARDVWSKASKDKDEDGVEKDSEKDFLSDLISNMLTNAGQGVSDMFETIFGGDTKEQKSSFTDNPKFGPDEVVRLWTRQLMESVDKALKEDSNLKKSSRNAISNACTLTLGMALRYVNENIDHAIIGLKQDLRSGDIPVYQPKEESGK
jgi:hypothetical protein